MAYDAMDQLNQIAMATQPVHRGRGRGRGQGQRGRGQPHEFNQGRPQEVAPQHMNQREQSHHHRHHPHYQAWDTAEQTPTTDMNAFPPLGPNQPQHRRQQHNHPPTQRLLPQSQSQDFHASHGPPQQFQQQPPQYQRGQYSQPVSLHQGANYVQHQGQPSARGSFDAPRGRGSRGGYQQQRHNSSYQTQSQNNQPLANTNDFTRPPGNSNQRLYTPDNNTHFATGDQQRAFRHKIMTQSDFLASLASQNLKNQMTQEELQAKESFRKRLQDIARQAVASLDHESTNMNVDEIKLRLYGSLGSGFAVAGSDMDLLLAFPQHDSNSEGVEIETRRVLEKALLEAGYGARLLTNTRVPILKVCEKPSPELLSNLRAYRLEWELNEAQAKSSSPPDRGNELLPSLDTSQAETAVEALASLDLDAADVPLPASPILEQAKLEFSSDCGIQCDVNFSNYVALHNTELLKAYGRADSRVRQMGIFIKNWAKTRDINTPYKGTLSSYGYILMVLHYLMNVVRPPVIPNLQEVKKSQDEWQNNQNILLVEGFDVRFIRDPEEVQDLLRKMPKNHESLGSLLRGFFWYYSAPQGFHWGQDVISIRTGGGRLTKRSKGWTEAKWANQSSHVRLRYLLAIEDPFEIEHNVGRTVGHSGIVAVRDEFRRAWSIIDAVQYDASAKTYHWVKKDTSERQNAEDFMSALTDRGDLLRKDQTFHRDKMRRMRQEAEANEQAMKEEVLEISVSSTVADNAQKNGTWTDENSESLPGVNPSPQSNWVNEELIDHRSYQGKKRERKEVKNRPSRRQVQDEWDDTDDGEDNSTSEVVSRQDKSKTVSNCQSEKWEMKSAKGQVIAGLSQTYTTDGDSRNSEKSGNHKEKHSPNFARDTTVETHLEPHNHGHCPDKKVGRDCAWDRQTNGGRWLLWRDRVMRAEGSLNYKQPVYANLNAKFPYNPDMSYADLAEMNVELRKHHTIDLWPAGMPNITQPMKKSLNIPRREDIPQDNVNDCPIDESVASLPTKFEAPLDRQRQHLLPASDTSDGSVLSKTPSVVDVQELREKRNIYFARNTKQHTSDCVSEPWRDSAVSFDETEGSDVDRLSVKDRVVIQSSAEECAPKIPDHQRNLLSLLNVRDVPAPEQVVPLTLYPDVSNGQRPRDEDPMIMPIPRTAGFRFDPRQLEDLDVIRQGGNGCAKKGEQFNIEEEYEFGGGGEMAYKSSSGLRCMSESGLQLSWRPGQGDQEGLLDELPGSM